METVDPRTAVLDRIDALNKAMPDFRVHESTVKGLKAEVAAANIRIGVADPKLSSADLNHLVELYLNSW